MTAADWATVVLFGPLVLLGVVAIVVAAVSGWLRD